MDAIPDILPPSGPIIVIYLLLAFLAFSAFHRSNLNSFPGPLLARLSDVWISWHTARGTVNRAVHEAHKTYGPFVRIAPNHVSISHSSALQPIYGHSVGILKSEFYDIFTSFNGTKSVFTTRSRDEHARKRKILSHTFSQKSTLEFEPMIGQHISGLFRQWDHMCSVAAEGNGGIIGDTAWASHEGCAVVDTLDWYSFVIFDVIGELVFRIPFGMTDRGSDETLVAKRPDQAMASHESNSTEMEYDSIRAVQMMNERSALMVPLGMLPKYWRPLIERIPMDWIRRGNAGVEKMSALVKTAIADGCKNPSQRNDILSKYLDATDDRGRKMGISELYTEALVLLAAGADTTAHSLAAITFYLAQCPAAQTKLQVELDGALGAPSAVDDDSKPTIASYDSVKNLPYLQDVVNEGLRLFSAVGVGLPRVVPEGGLTVLGRTLAPGTIVSVPAYVIHRDKAAWGEDAESFNPDRWTKGDKTEMMKAFVPFSIGPRACIARNLALMEMFLFVANVFHRYEVKLASQLEMDIHDGFTRRPLASIVALKRRGF